MSLRVTCDRCGVQSHNPAEVEEHFHRGVSFLFTRTDSPEKIDLCHPCYVSAREMDRVLRRDARLRRWEWLAEEDKGRDRLDSRREASRLAAIQRCGVKDWNATPESWFENESLAV